MKTAVAALLLALALIACTGIKDGLDEFNKIAAIVVADIQAGKNDVAIVADVEVALGASVTVEVATEIVLNIVNDLLASGLLAKHYDEATVARAQALQPMLAAKVTACANAPRLK